MKVKRVLLLISLCISLVCSAREVQSKYYVHKCSGEVSLLKGDLYKSVVKGEYVNVDDSLRIGERSSISIVDNTTNRVYLCNEMCHTTVAQIILSAREQSEAITRLVYKQAMQSINEDSKKSVSLGAAYRGKKSQSTFTKLVYSSICNQLDFSKIEASDKITLSRVAKDGEWFFRIGNHSSELMYFGIVRLNKGKPEQVLEVGRFEGVSVLAVEPGAYVELSQFAFVETPTEVSYLLFASSTIFDTQELALLFKSGSVSSNESETLPLLYTLSK